MEMISRALSRLSLQRGAIYDRGLVTEHQMIQVGGATRRENVQWSWVLLGKLNHKVSTSFLGSSNRELIWIDWEARADFSLMPGDVRIRTRRNCTADQARSIGARHAQGEWILFADSDLDIDASFLTSAQERFENDRWTGMIVGHPEIGRLFAIRAELWSVLGGIDGAYRGGPWADLDLAMRLLGLGYSTVSLCGSSVKKRQGDSEDREKKCEELFFQRWLRDPNQVSFDHFRAKQPILGSRRSQSVIITAITRGYDDLRAPRSTTAQDAAWVAFLDDVTRKENSRSIDRWQVRNIPQSSLGEDSNRIAKTYKVMPHLHFPEAEYSLWVDGSIVSTFPFELSRLIELYLDGADLCVFNHSKRSCIYQEAIACKWKGLDDASRIDDQVSKYRENGYPEFAGLAELPVILRRHTPKVQHFNEVWWEEIQNGSKRDQLSFNYVAWKLGMKFNRFPLRIGAWNGLFKKELHRC